MRWVLTWISTVPRLLRGLMEAFASLRRAVARMRCISRARTSLICSQSIQTYRRVLQQGRASCARPPRSSWPKTAQRVVKKIGGHSRGLAVCFPLQQTGSKTTFDMVWTSSTTVLSAPALPLAMLRLAWLMMQTVHQPCRLQGITGSTCASAAYCMSSRGSPPAERA